MCVTFSPLGHFGRLGNQLFEIAATIGIAIDNNDIAVFHEWYCHYTKKNMSQFFKNPISDTLSKEFSAVTHKESTFHYTPISYTGDNIILIHSYFQSEKYFKRHESLIRWYFEPSETMVKRLNAKYGEILSKEMCSIHVRIGDYADNAYHAGCDMDYYNTAIEYVKKNVKVENFVVFSDNIKWCKEHFPPDFIYIENELVETGIESIYRTNDSDVEELFLMSMCKHNIIANSSFSWWGSWLNKNSDKIVIAPKQWFGTADLNTDDVYTNNMIKL